jgi:hypothetical protein
MSRLRTAYLREMGIDVWVLRENVAADGGALSRLSAQAPAAARALAVAPENVRPSASAPLPTASPALLPAATTAPERVPASGPALPSKFAPSMPAVAAKKAIPVEAATKAQAVADPEFLMCLLDFTRDEHALSCLFLLPYSAAGLPPEINRFASDVAIACLGGPCEPRRTDLRWPMVKSSHIAQSADDAKQVVVSKVKACGRDVLVFGSEALTYCGLEPSVESGAESGATAGITAHGKRLWPLAEFDHYSSVAKAKARLWRILSIIRARDQ